MVSLAGQPWCTGNFTEPTPAMCQTLIGNSPVTYLPGLLAAGVPLEWCHSPDDQTIPLLTTQLFLAPYSLQYIPSVSVLTPKGVYGMAHLLCAACSIPNYLTMNDNGLDKIYWT